MNEKECLEKMDKLIEKRQQQIDEDFKNEGRLKTVINDVKYLGKIRYIEEVDGKREEKEKDIFTIIEENDGNIWYKYYDENMQLIAAENGFQQLALSGNVAEKNSDVLEKIEKLDKMEGTSLSETKEEYRIIEEVARKQGIEVEDIENYKKLNLNQEIDNDEENKVIDSDETKKLDIREKTNLSQNIEGRTLGNKLGINNITLPDGSKLTDGKYLAVVSTSSLNKYKEKNSSQRYSFAVIRENGEAVPLGDDVLVDDERTGMDPIRADLTINNDGRVNRESNVASFRIVNGNRNEYLKIGNDEISGHEIKYSKYSPTDGKYISTELRTDKDMYIRDDVRQYLKDSSEGIRKAEKTLDRSEIHEKCDEKEDVSLVDNNQYNDSHVHIDADDFVPNTNLTWGEYANQLGYRGEDAVELAIKKYEETLESDQSLNSKEIIEQTVEEANEDFRNPQELDH